MFEQSYGGVEGDSASLAELCALLSAIGGFAIRQDLAMTGSVDQRGLAQAIGGVNEKIEGFFDTCAARGLSGTQGVIIPEPTSPTSCWRPGSGVPSGRVDSASWPSQRWTRRSELLSGMPAGVADAAGDYPPDTANGRVQDSLRRMAELARQFSSERTDGIGQGGIAQKRSGRAHRRRATA